jgi:hypothetical protein
MISKMISGATMVTATGVAIALATADFQHCATNPSDYWRCDNSQAPVAELPDGLPRPLPAPIPGGSIFVASTTATTSWDAIAPLSVGGSF